MIDSVLSSNMDFQTSATREQKKKRRRRRQAKKVSEDQTGLVLAQAHDGGKVRTCSDDLAPIHKKQRKTSDVPNHAFPVDESDHCETPLEAYQDISMLLDFIAKSLGKKRDTLRVYDPYYCDGGVKSKLGSLGFQNVTNDNEDFYDNIAKGRVPAHDVLVTNPPYSGQHMEKLLSFASKNRKPFLLLLPHFVYTKDYYERGLGSDMMSKMFYIVPRGRYSYIPPSWVSSNEGSTALLKGKTRTAPFPSFWYVCIPVASDAWLSKTLGPSGSFDAIRNVQYANCTSHIPREFKGEFDTSNKRPNPRARKRAAAKKRKSLTVPSL